MNYIELRPDMTIGEFAESLKKLPQDAKFPVFHYLIPELRYAYPEGSKPDSERLAAACRIPISEETA